MRIFTFCLLLLWTNICRAQTPSALNASLFAAVEAQDVARVQSLLKRNVNPNARNQYNYTPLLSALQAKPGAKQLSSQNLAIVRLLLANGANPNLGVPRGIFPMMSARQSAPALKLLLDAGASVDGRDDYGHTVLMWLCLYRQLTPVTLQLLLEHGADPNARDENGDTPLLEAVVAGIAGSEAPWNEEISFAQLTDQLLAAGARLNLANDRGETVLMNAAHRQQTGNVRVLLARGANINARDKSGQTALMRACQLLWNSTFPYGGGALASYRWPSSEMIHILLANGADADARDAAGQSALIWLVKSNPYDFANLYGQELDLPAVARERKQKIAAIARLLIANGTNASLASDNGNTALKWAKARGNTELVNLLQAAGK